MQLLLKLSLVFFLATSCITMQKVPKDAKMEDYFYFQPAEKNDSSKWVVFLPGTGGLKPDEDPTHYFDTAKKLNAEGFSVLLVDFVAAYKASKREGMESTGEEIIWTLEQAMQWAKDYGKINRTSEGSIVGWSLAGLGIIPLANNSQKIDSLNIQSIALFYPANPEEIQLDSKIPVLIMTGGKDNITPAETAKKYLSTENSEIIIYENAWHGFDAEGLKEKKGMRFPPFFGKKYLLKYDKEAAEKSLEELVKFLKEN